MYVCMYVCLYVFAKAASSGGSRISQTGRGTNPADGSNLLFGKLFPENYMKMKKILDCRDGGDASLDFPFRPTKVKLNIRGNPILYQHLSAVGHGDVRYFHAWESIGRVEKVMSSDSQNSKKTQCITLLFNIFTILH